MQRADIGTGGLQEALREAEGRAAPHSSFGPFQAAQPAAPNRRVLEGAHASGRTACGAKQTSIEGAHHRPLETWFETGAKTLIRRWVGWLVGRRAVFFIRARGSRVKPPGV